LLLSDSRTPSLFLGFEFTNDANDWIAQFIGHPKPSHLKNGLVSQPYQKINQFPNGEIFSTKDQMWSQIQKLQKIHGKAAFSYTPDTYVLPSEIESFKMAWEQDKDKSKLWILKDVRFT
jgi:hypothetical protein